MTPEQYRKQFAEDEAVGWNAIDAALAKVYGEQKCRHYAASIPFELGGDEPLSGISIYDVAATNTAPFHRHVVSYGMSELFYSPESAGAELAAGYLNSLFASSRSPMTTTLTTSHHGL